MYTDSPQAPTNAQVFLGLFIVGQLFFLVAANLIGLLNHGRPYLSEEPSAEMRTTFKGEMVHGTRLVLDQIAPGWTSSEGHVNDAFGLTSEVLTRWSQLTGQPQFWSLFAPGINTVTTFVAVELRWNDPFPERRLSSRLGSFAATDPVQASVLAAVVRLEEASQAQPPPPYLLLSDNEPQDLSSFLRIGRFRLRRYEDNLYLQLSSQDDKVDERRVDGWRRQIEDKVRGDWPSIRAYLAWRLAAFQRRRPDLPAPTQVILLVRVYHIPPPDEASPPGFWARPDQRPVARWRPGVEEEGFLPIEMYNPVVDRYERLKARPGE